MFDATKLINEHWNFLKINVEKLSESKRLQFALWCFDFALNLPNAEETLKKFYKLNIRKDNYIHFFENNEKRLECQKEISTSLENMNEYDDNFQELDYIEIYVLVAFETCIHGLDEASHLAFAAENIINILDFYQDFDEENEEFWNKLCEKEFEIQRLIVKDLLDNKKLNAKMHHEEYEKINFKII